MVFRRQIGTLYMFVWWFWGDLGMILRWFWDDLGMIWGCFGDVFGMIWGWFGDALGSNIFENQKKKYQQNIPPSKIPNIFLAASEGGKWMDRPKKQYFEKIFFRKKCWKHETFFLTIYQLKNTSDCIKIDPPGPGRNLKKHFKSVKNDPNCLGIFALKTCVFLM